MSHPKLKLPPLKGPQLTSNFLDELGTERVVEGETLRALSDALIAEGYAGRSIPARDPAGITRGWVRAGNWRSA